MPRPIFCCFLLMVFVNPAGVFFGRQAIVNVGMLHAVGGSLSDEDFLNGIDRFTNLSGAVVNEGFINAGEVYLIGSRVANYGTIVAPDGVIALVAGDEVYLTRRDIRVHV